MNDLAPGRVTDGIDIDALRALCTAAVPPAQDQVAIDMIPVEDLIIDRSYQRRVSDNSRTRMRRIIRDFSWSKFGALTVARVADGFAVIDGQHRAIAAMAVSARYVPAVIVRADTREQAEDFVGINATRTAVASIDKFRARVAAGDQDALRVNEVLTELEISTDVPAGAAIGPKETRAVGLLEKLVKRIGKGQLFVTLETLLDAQPNQANLLTAFAIEATAAAVTKIIDEEGDLDRLVKVVAEIDFLSLKDDAHQLVKLTGGRLAVRGHELILKAYNKNLKRRVA